MVHHLAAEVNLFGFDLSALRLQAKQRAPRSVVRRVENLAVVHERSGYVGRAI